MRKLHKHLHTKKRKSNIIEAIVRLSQRYHERKFSKIDFNEKYDYESLAIDSIYSDVEIDREEYRV